MEIYLTKTDIINWKHPEVNAKAAELSSGLSDKNEITKICFQWVRDKISHLTDTDVLETAYIASDVLKLGVGACYAKSHLLAALLRANSIPAGFCYQILSLDEVGPPFILHGLNAVYLPDHGWYRIDSRGNTDGVDAQFNPPREQLAFTPKIKGEIDLPEIWPDPLPVVIEALKKYKTSDILWENLPTVEILTGLL